jgi:hypothetical protein
MKQQHTQDAVTLDYSDENDYEHLFVTSVPYDSERSVHGHCLPVSMFSLDALQLPRACFAMLCWARRAIGPAHSGNPSRRARAGFRVLLGSCMHMA